MSTIDLGLWWCVDVGTSSVNKCTTLVLILVTGRLCVRGTGGQKVYRKVPSIPSSQFGSETKPDLKNKVYLKGKEKGTKTNTVRKK